MAAISIIVPIYNVEKYLHQCLQSIINQSFSDIEIILINDGSTDGCYDICEEYKKRDSRIVVVHKENSGLVNARKTGISYAHGDYIAYVDADDWIEPNMFERMYQIMIKQSVDIVMCGRYEDTGKVSKSVYHEMKEGKYDKQALLNSVYPRLILDDTFIELGLIPSIWDKLYKRDLIIMCQELVDDRIVMGEDAACVYPCLINANSIYIIHECLYHYRQTTSSMIKQVKSYQIERNEFRILYQTINSCLNQYLHIFDMRLQWKKYVLSLMLPRADGLYQGYQELDYLFPFQDVKRGSHIVLYGAGTYGQRLYQYLKESKFCYVVAWVDRNYIELQKMGLCVQDPLALSHMDYDEIIVANISASSRNEIYQELIKKFPKEKVQIFKEELISSWETTKAFGLHNTYGLGK